MKLFGLLAFEKQKPPPAEEQPKSRSDVAKQVVELTDQLTAMSAELRKLVHETIENEKASDDEH